jgi:hypothetical protein
MTRQIINLGLAGCLIGACSTVANVREGTTSRLTVPAQAYDVLALCALDALDATMGLNVNLAGARYVDYRPAQRARITAFQPVDTTVRPVWEVEVSQAGGDVLVTVRGRNTDVQHALVPCVGTARWVEEVK